MFFHLDYINPLVEKDVHTKIENYVKNKLDSLQKFDSYETKFDACLLKRELGLFKWWFYDRSNKYAEFKIISLIEEKHRVFFLIEAIDDKHIQCVVEFDENLENLIRFYF